ncbi:MAG: phosphoenolpyruvate carboxykinase (ATP) [Candidatus Alcyoniella australis]|nr:phosphoenolpyruvate carboxykinase (ATP) [Candidatus Alcyoniella australis]
MTNRVPFDGLIDLGEVHWNLSVPVLYEHCVKRGEGQVCQDGPLLVMTGQYTGRSPKDKYFVRNAATANKVWWSDDNQPITRAVYDRLEAKVRAFLHGRDVYVQDCYVGADPKYRVPLRVISQKACHSIFARHMFINETDRRKLSTFQPEYTVIAVPDLKAVPELDEMRTEVSVAINTERRTLLVAGSGYGGEIKKSVFTLMNYLLPQRNILSMHCSANVGEAGDTAIFFGLSGTGKTTLSSDPERHLIGDDEHGWSDDGVFNLEAGCYAKVINLSAKAEPQIWQATHRFGAMLENVAVNQRTRKIDMSDPRYTVNTRAMYPIEFIPGSVHSGMGDHPKNIVMLTCDAFGVLPPIAKLDSAQAMYHFISGYTAKVAGTERGITEPQATFSTCFGAPFMSLHPTVYSKLLGAKIAKHKSVCWLINTGWTGGPDGIGHRMQIAHTRAMVSAALSGKLDAVGYDVDPTFGMLVPRSCPDVPQELLTPRNTWKNKRAYDDKSRELAHSFNKNFERFASQASKRTRMAGPKI